jgi:TolA-binding protein
MKTQFKLFAIAMLSTVFITTACNSGQDYKGNNLENRQERQQELKELQSKLNNYESEIDATLRDKPIDFRERMYQSLDSIEVRLDDFQKLMKESGGTFSATTQQKIENLKIRFVQLHDRMDKWSPNDWDQVENVVMKDWESFKKEAAELTAGNDDLNKDDNKM